MEESYEYKYLKYKLKYLKIKYELEGAGITSLLKSKLDKAMDNVYEKIGNYIYNAAYKKPKKDINYKTLKKNFKKIFTKNPLIGKKEKDNFKKAKKARETRLKVIKTDISDCNAEYHATNKNKKKKKIDDNIKKLEAKLEGLNYVNKLEIDKDSGNISNSGFRLVNYTSNDNEVNNFKKNYNIDKFKKETKIKATDNELNLYIKFWLMQSKFFNLLTNKMQKKSTLHYGTTCRLKFAKKKKR